MDTLKLLLVLLVFMVMVYESGVAGAAVKEGKKEKTKKPKKPKVTKAPPPAAPAAIESSGAVLEGKAKAKKKPAPKPAKIKYDKKSCVVGPWKHVLELPAGKTIAIRSVQVPWKRGGSKCPDVAQIGATSAVVLEGPESPEAANMATCSVGPWTQWEYTGSGNRQQRTREVKYIDPRNPICPPLIQYRDFGHVNCQVGLWSAWVNFPAFNVMVRYRLILVEPQNGGTPCPAIVDVKAGPGGGDGCHYTPWSAWTMLSNGQCARFRDRQDGQPATCVCTYDFSTYPCGGGGGGGCQYSAWSPYYRNRAKSGCVATKTRTVLSGSSCSDTSHDIACQDCTWSAWSAWQEYVRDHLLCLERQTRYVLTAADQYGDACVGGTQNVRVCPDPCSQACPAAISPVCGSNGVTYDNLCKLQKAACVAGITITVANQGPCFCSQFCPSVYMPVCGSNGVTYSNECEMNKAACTAGISITIAYYGSCSTCGQPCTTYIASVCGSNGVTYSNVCEMNKAACVAGITITVAYQGQCSQCGPACTTLYDPVCGSNGVTYGNVCQMNMAACVAGITITVAYQGQCSVCGPPCTTPSALVCGSNRVTYNNVCEMNKAACVAGITITVAYGGPCSQCGPACTSLYTPVCASNGVTYGNDCEMERAACLASITLTVVHTGPCECPWGGWSQWTAMQGPPCRESRTRTRNHPCSGTSTQTRSANCGCDWNNWGPWTSFTTSPSCQERRTRTIQIPCQDNPEHQDRPCDCGLSSADIVFLVDQSGSIDDTEWNQLKQFILDVINKFTIGNDQIQVGLVTFTHTVENEFFLNAYGSKAAVLAHVNGIQNREGSTHTDAGLRYVRLNSFQQIHGDRADKPNILVILTDGFATTGHEPATEAALLRQAGVKIVAIGIGIGSDLSQLQSMASTPSDVFAVPGFDALKNIEDKVDIATCPVCEISVADIIFVVDVSGSISDAEWSLAKQFLTDLISALPIGQDTVRIGILTYDHVIQIEFHLNMHNTLGEVLARVQALVNRQGSTYTSRALKTAREQMFTAARGDRANANDVLIVLTDGASTPTFGPAAEALLLHARGVKVIAIGVGTFTDKSELAAMASGPGLVFDVQSFGDLIATEQSIIAELCQVCETDYGDIVILLDASGSMNAAEWQQQIGFIIDLIQGFSIGPNHIQIGVATFDHFVQHEFYLNRYSNLADVIAHIGTIPNRNGATLTSIALEFVRNEMFTTARGDRPTAKNILVVFSDGASTNGFEPFAEAQLLKNAGIKVVAIGVGAGTDRSELVSMASNLECIFDVTDAAALTKIRSQVQDRTCEVCEIGKADIVVMIDASGSIDATEWAKEMQFLLDLFQGFPIGATQIQVGLLTFDDAAVIERHLNENTGGLAALLADIQGLANRGGPTFTSTALERIRLEMFILARGDRAGVDNILIILTDGDSTPGYEPNAEITLIKAAGVKVIVIGVGPLVDTSELTFMSSGPQYLYEVTDFDALSDIRDQVQMQTCEEGCQTSLLDIVFVLDVSGSVTDAYWAQSKQFALDLVQDFNIGVNNIMIALVTFSNTITNEFHLNTHSTKAAVMSHITGVSNRQGSTWTMDALHHVRTQNFIPGNGDRGNAKNVVIIITDGMSTTGHLPIAEATALKNAGVVIIAIGVGPHTDEAELLGMATNADHKFDVDDFNALLDIEAKVQHLACQE